MLKRHSVDIFKEKVSGGWDREFQTGMKEKNQYSRQRDFGYS